MPPTSFLAPPTLSLHALLESTSSSNPGLNIDLEWEPFHSHVDAFLKAIDKYTLAAKTAIADRATEFVTSEREFKAEKEERERQIQLEQQREREMLLTIESERHTLADLTSSLTRLQMSLTKVREQGTALEYELAAVRKEARLEQAAKERQVQMLGEMRERNGLELEALENALGLRLIGVGEGRMLLVLFTLIDVFEPTREFSFILDVSQHDYPVPKCDPPIAEMPDLIRQLNKDRDVYTFIKKVRAAFVALVTPPPIEITSRPTAETAPAEGMLIEI